MRSLWGQFAVLALVSLLIGLGNNFRSAVKMEWIRDWPPYSSVAKVSLEKQDAAQVTEAPTPESAASESQDPQELSSKVMELVSGNQGVTDLDLEQAKQIYSYAADFTLWVDARSPELYEQGHIKNAFLCFLYEKNHYLPELESKIAELQPLSLVIYCKGEECTDSHTLAQDLQNMGYSNIFVYTGGFEQWYKANLPIEGALAKVSTTPGEDGTVRPALDEKPPGMYLEHVVRDLIPFVLGLMIALFWKQARTNRAAFWASILMVGVFFVWAAIPKLHAPFLFAKNIWNYDLAPAWAINFSAMAMPGAEFIAGLSLLTGFFRKAGSLMIAILLVIFILAVGYNIGRGHEFNCGCMTSTPLFSQIYLNGWNDKLLLLLRDLGLLASTMLLFLYSEKSKVKTE